MWSANSFCEWMRTYEAPQFVTEHGSDFDLNHQKWRVLSEWIQFRCTFIHFMTDKNEWMNESSVYWCSSCRDNEIVGDSAECVMHRVEKKFSSSETSRIVKCTNLACLPLSQVAMSFSFGLTQNQSILIQTFLFIFAWGKLKPRSFWGFHSKSRIPINRLLLLLERVANNRVANFRLDVLVR